MISVRFGVSDGAIAQKYLILDRGTKRPAIRDSRMTLFYLISYLPQTGALRILYVYLVTRQAACRLGCHYGDESGSISTWPVFG